MSIEAMKQALDALELLRYGAKNSYPINASITSLRQAIAEAEKQELVCVCGCVWEGQELVSSPPQRQPLTDEQIAKCYETTGHYQTLRPQDRFAVFALARAIEAAHGIKGEA